MAVAQSAEKLLKMFAKVSWIKLKKDRSIFPRAFVSRTTNSAFSRHKSLKKMDIIAASSSILRLSLASLSHPPASVSHQSTWR
jgi:hypothetical protein